MLTYATLGSNDIDRAVPFYEALFEGTGITRLFEHPSGGTVFGKDGKLVLGILRPFDRAAASVGNGSMLAFDLPTREAVDTFHAKALSLGASDEGAPGERGPGFYMSYFRDLDGHKICACRIG